VTNRTKAQCRDQARSDRLALVFDNDRHIDAISEFLLSPQRVPGWVVGYSPMGGEVDLRGLYKRQDLAPFALTRTPDRSRGLDLTVHPFESPSETHPYGYQQPVADAPVVADNEIGVVLVPGLAFSRAGVRLGHGMGYYDRFLARLLPYGTQFIGVTGGYIVDDLPADEHDIGMSHLVDAQRVWAVDQAV